MATNKLQVLDWSLKFRFFDLSKITVFVLDEADVMIATQVGLLLIQMWGSDNLSSTCRDIKTRALGFTRIWGPIVRCCSSLLPMTRLLLLSIHVHCIWMENQVRIQLCRQ